MKPTTYDAIAEARAAEDASNQELLRRADEHFRAHHGDSVLVVSSPESIAAARIALDRDARKGPDQTRQPGWQPASATDAADQARGARLRAMARGEA